MAFTTQVMFTSDINGVKVRDIESKIDYKLNNYKEREEKVNEILEFADNFYQEYFDDFCSVSINSDDALLSDTNVVKSLEKMATYLLMADDVKSRKNTDYQFFSKESSLDSKTIKEKEYSSTGASYIDESDDKAIPEAKSQSNYKKVKKQVISSADVNRKDELGDVLSDYNDFLTFLRAEKEKSASQRKHSVYLYSRHIGMVKDDMLICKDSFLGVHGYNLKYFSESTNPDYSKIDFTNSEHLLGKKIKTEEGKNIAVRGLLYFSSNDDLQNDFNCILIDLQNVIDKTDLTQFEIDTLELSRLNLSVVDIAKELETYDAKIKRTMKLIAKKVSKKAIELGYKSGGIFI